MADDQKKDDDQEEFVKVLFKYADHFNSHTGQAVLADMKKTLDQASYTPGRHHDEVIWREGRRSVYLDILSILETAKLHLEAAQNEQTTYAEGVTGDPLDL